MSRLIRDVVLELSPWPGAEDFTERNYAIDILKNYADTLGLCEWDEVEKLHNPTEHDLMDGTDSWLQYSCNGHSLIWTESISMRLFGKRQVSISPEKLVELQADILKKAAGLLLQALV